jgi:hypothetical protein
MIREMSPTLRKIVKEQMAQQVKLKMAIAVAETLTSYYRAQLFTELLAMVEADYAGEPTDPVIDVSDAQFGRITELLEHPPEPTPALRSLFRRELTFFEWLPS